MKIDNVECHVACEDQILTEYQEKSEDDPLKGKSCYIISETGKCFVVRIKRLSRRSAHEGNLSAQLWIDGQRLRKRTLCDDGCYDIGDVRVDEFTVRPLIFTSITLTDDDRTLQEDNANINDLGTICLKFYRVKVLGDVTHAYSACPVNLEDKPVHERSKKAGGHRVILGEARVDEVQLVRNVEYVDGRNSPYCTFTWRYRSKDILQAQGIVPLDPVPSPSKRLGSPIPSGSSSKRPRTEQSPSQQGSSSQVKLEDVSTAQERQARVEALRAQLEEEEAALKEELRRANAAGVKREVSPIVLKGVSGDVIDLTEDD